MLSGANVRDELEDDRKHEEVSERHAGEEQHVLANTSGSTSRFSCAYRPGATNAHT